MYTWCAIYENGETIHENSESPNIPISRLDLDKLKRFELLPVDNVPPVILTWKKGRKLIFKRQFAGAMPISCTTPLNISLAGVVSNEIEFDTLGWSETGPDEKERFYLIHIYPNGSIELSDSESPSFIDDFVKLYLKAS